MQRYKMAVEWAGDEKEMTQGGLVRQRRPLAAAPPARAEIARAAAQMTGGLGAVMRRGSVGEIWGVAAAGMVRRRAAVADGPVMRRGPREGEGAMEDGKREEKREERACGGLLKRGKERDRLESAAEESGPVICTASTTGTVARRGRLRRRGGRRQARVRSTNGSNAAESSTRCSTTPHCDAN